MLKGLAVYLRYASTCDRRKAQSRNAASFAGNFHTTAWKEAEVDFVFAFEQKYLLYASVSVSCSLCSSQ